MKQVSAWVVCCVAVIASTCVSARADVTIWFELVSSDVGISSLDHGPGKVLLLSNPMSATPFNVTARMVGNVSGVGVTIDSTTFSADYGVSVSATDAVVLPNGILNTVGGVGVPGPGDIATNFGQTSFDFPAPGFVGASIDFGTVTFTIDPTLGAYDNGQIFARVGPGLWGLANFSGAQIRFGNGGFVDGANTDVGKAPVIQIIPEPAAITLILLAATPMLRRRRR
ncbi:MAG TPA: hypothetical protein P5081_17200 [Phycisphaerae bacterium]|nr:hypothetical protein [Phycisphaerae bacterium]HRW54611.1 hypothetical protein [Phycisphaerae bacterium]